MRRLVKPYFDYYRLIHFSHCFVIVVTMFAFSVFIVFSFDPVQQVLLTVKSCTAYQRKKKKNRVSLDFVFAAWINSEQREH